MLASVADVLADMVDGRGARTRSSVRRGTGPRKRTCDGLPGHTPGSRRGVPRPVTAAAVRHRYLERMSNATAMDDVDEGTPEVDGIRTLAEQAARVQDVLGDLDLALVPGGETPAMRLLGELKRAWRD